MFTLSLSSPGYSGLLIYKGSYFLTKDSNFLIEDKSSLTIWLYLSNSVVGRFGLDSRRFCQLSIILLLYFNLKSNLTISCFTVDNWPIIAYVYLLLLLWSMNIAINLLSVENGSQWWLWLGSSLMWNIFFLSLRFEKRDFVSWYNLTREFKADENRIKLPSQKAKHKFNIRTFPNPLIV